MATHVDTTTLPASRAGGECTAVCTPPAHTAVILPFPPPAAPLPWTHPVAVERTIREVEQLDMCCLLDTVWMWSPNTERLAADPNRTMGYALRQFLMLARVLDDADFCVAEVLS